MLAVKEQNYRGNVVNKKTDDNKWYLDFIRNPNISTNAKVVFLNLRTNNDNYNENVKSLMLKCNLSERLVSKALKELEDLKLVSKKMKRDSGRFFYLYITSVENIPSPIYRTTVDHGRLTVPYKYNKNINKTNDDNKEKNHHEISEIENVENSVIEFADKSDSKKANELFDEVIYNSDVFNFSIQDSRIKNIKLDNIPKAIKKNNLALVLETIKMFPEYAKKTNQGLNPKGKFTENEMLTYLKTILNNDCQYPKWFNDLYKQESVKQAVKTVEDNWKPITSIWKAYGNRIDDSIKIMIETILNFISESEKYKKENKPDSNYLKITRQTFKESTQKTLKIKSIDEMIHLINEYSNKEWNNADKFKEVISNYFDNNSLDTIKAYFQGVI